MEDIILSGFVSLMLGYIIPQPKWAKKVQDKLRALITKIYNRIRNKK